ncbi:MAG TPA: DUF2264 domain-containing protein [Bacillota bacterium]|nr:DUF2264 domain-containing protein [Bacillota bacterium]
MTTYGPNTVKEIQNNPIETKGDLQLLMAQMAEPLGQYFSQDKAYLCLGNTDAHYSRQVAGYEAFSRPLWGISPLIAGGGSTSIWHEYIEGLKNGTNRDHPEFWGYPRDYDQRTVETAAIGLTLALCREEINASFNEEEKNNVYQWISVVNGKKTPDNNWNLFKVLVNLGLKQIGMPFDHEANEQAFERIETYYLGDGWYSDGQTDQKDYYVSFAIHFYCLIYAKLMETEDSERSALYKDRAIQFAQDFIYWFSADGSSIPFGRSMTYRFAQTAFWSALAFADVEALPWGVIKGLVLRHLRWWMRRPIFTHDGLLTIGYGYPNLIMTESYNAPGSPYWGMKSFLVLALGEEHPFWKQEEQPLPKLDTVKTLKHAQMIMCRDESSDHVYGLTSGQYAGFEPAHTAAKYSKFAYSNLFGFSVSREPYGLNNGAFDSMLALAERDNYYRVRRRCEETEVTDEYVYSLWKPWNDVTVETWLIPLDGWHVRVHHIQNDRELNAAEGGFATPVTDPYMGLMKPNQPYAETNFGSSGIVDLFGDRELKMIRTAPNTNMIHSNVSEIPTLTNDLDIGEHWLAAAVYAHTDKELFNEHWNTPPQVFQDDETVKIIHQEIKIDITKVPIV